MVVVGQTKSVLKHVNNSHRNGALPQVWQGSGTRKALFHRCPYGRDPKFLFARELKTYTTNVLRLLIAATVCGLYFLLDLQLLGSEHQSINSLIALAIGWAGGLFVILAILTGVSYVKKKKEGT